jgi:hypothetical protein
MQPPHCACAREPITLSRAPTLTTLRPSPSTFAAPALAVVRGGERASGRRARAVCVLRQRGGAPGAAAERRGRRGRAVRVPGRSVAPAVRYKHPQTSTAVTRARARSRAARFVGLASQRASPAACAVPTGAHPHLCCVRRSVLPTMRPLRTARVTAGLSIRLHSGHGRGAVGGRAAAHGAGGQLHRRAGARAPPRPAAGATTPRHTPCSRLAAMAQQPSDAMSLSACTRFLAC